MKKVTCLTTPGPMLGGSQALLPAQWGESQCLVYRCSMVFGWSAKIADSPQWGKNQYGEKRERATPER